MNNIKDTLTTVLAVVLLVAGAVNTYLQSIEGDIDWYQLLLAVVAAVVAYFTGKTANGKVKSTEALIQQKNINP
jgi:uncharacterized membrane protein YfcA